LLLEPDSRDRTEVTRMKLQKKYSEIFLPFLNEKEKWDIEKKNNPKSILIYLFIYLLINQLYTELRLPNQKSRIYFPFFSPTYSLPVFSFALFCSYLLVFQCILFYFILFYFIYHICIIYIYIYIIYICFLFTIHRFLLSFIFFLLSFHPPPSSLFLLTSVTAQIIQPFLMKELLVKVMNKLFKETIDDMYAGLNLPISVQDFGLF
jgi:hypothetical protein